MRDGVQRKSWSLLPAMLLWAACASAGEPVIFPAAAKVWVNAAGVPVKVEVSEQTPEAVRAYVAKEVSAWRFEPPTINSVASEGITYLSLGVCAVETEQPGAFRLALEYRGNGPGNPANSPSLPAPSYPDGAGSRGIMGTWYVDYTIGADGRATVDTIRPEKSGQRGREYFRPALKQWIEQFVFLPEQVAGKPVSTRSGVRVNFSMGGTSKQQTQLRAAALEAKNSDACLVAKKAAGDTLAPVALDSPFKLLQSGG